VRRNRVAHIEETTMKRFHTLLVAAAVSAASIAGLAGSDPAAAAGDPFVGMQVLDMLCASKGGTPINTPRAIARCQEARGGSGFPVERLVCEGLLEGTFDAVRSYGRPSRITWACFQGAIG
jgi:hypothetical protein